MTIGIDLGDRYSRLCVLDESGDVEALEFISRLIVHIPDVRERQIIYYGAYANASGIRQQHRRARQEGGGPCGCHR